MDVSSPTVYDFRLTFTELHLLKVTSVTVMLNTTQESVITKDHLLYTTTPLSIDSSTLAYEVVGLPRYGTLLLGTVKLQTGDSFTQEDIFQNRLHYKLHRTAYSVVEDSIAFRVSAPQCQALAPTTLSIVHNPPTQLLDRVNITVEKLQVTYITEC